MAAGASPGGLSLSEIDEEQEQRRKVQSRWLEACKVGLRQSTTAISTGFFPSCVLFPSTRWRRLDGRLAQGKEELVRRRSEGS